MLTKFVFHIERGTSWLDGHVTFLKGEYESRLGSDCKIAPWISITILVNRTRSISKSGVASIKLLVISVGDNGTKPQYTWWRHQIEAVSALLALDLDSCLVSSVTLPVITLAARYIGTCLSKKIYQWGLWYQTKNVSSYVIFQTHKQKMQFIFYSFWFALFTQYILGGYLSIDSDRFRLPMQVYHFLVSSTLTSVDEKVVLLSSVLAQYGYNAH